MEVKLIPIVVEPVETARRLIMIRNKLKAALKRTPGRVRRKAAKWYWIGMLVSFLLILAVFTLTLLWAGLDYPPPEFLLYEPWFPVAAFLAGLLVATIPALAANQYRNAQIRSLGGNIAQACNSAVLIFDVAVVKSLLHPKPHPDDVVD